MHTIAIDFQHVTGPHTGKAIKKQFEEIAAKFKIRSKVFKIVADQAANVKKAFVDTTQCDDILTLATDLIRRQKNIDAIQEAERLRALQEQINREALESSIAEMNAPLTVIEPGRKRTAAELIDNFDEFEDTEEPDESIQGK